MTGFAPTAAAIWTCAFYDRQIQIWSLVMWLITTISKLWSMESTKRTFWRMWSRDSEQEQSHDQTSDLKLAVIKTHAILAIADWLLSPVNRLRCHFKFDQQALKWPCLWHLLKAFNEWGVKMCWNILVIFRHPSFSPRGCEYWDLGPQSYCSETLVEQFSYQ